MHDATARRAGAPRSWSAPHCMAHCSNLRHVLPICPQSVRAAAARALAEPHPPRTLPHTHSHAARTHTSGAMDNISRSTCRTRPFTWPPAALKGAAGSTSARARPRCMRGRLKCNARCASRSRGGRVGPPLPSAASRVDACPCVGLPLAMFHPCCLYPRNLHSTIAPWPDWHMRPTPRVRHGPNRYMLENALVKAPQQCAGEQPLCAQASAKPTLRSARETLRCSLASARALTPR